MKKLLHVLLLVILLAAPVQGIQNAVGEKNGKDVDSLIQALKDEDLYVRQAAAESFDKLRIINASLRAINDPNASVRICAVLILGNFGIIGPLIPALEDQNSSVRESAAFALGWLGNDQAVDPLIHALNDTNPDVRAEAAYSLGEIGDKRAVGPLIRALKDENSRVRNYATQALGNMNQTSSIPPGEAHSRELSLASSSCMFFGVVPGAERNCSIECIKTGLPKIWDGTSRPPHCSCIDAVDPLSKKLGKPVA
jgi:HEAT repeat protein